MKNCKGILLTVTLFCVNNVFAGMYRPLPSVPMTTITLDAILKDALGNDTQGNRYAAKANEIYRYNYVNAMRRGSVNLNLMLDREIRNINNNASLDQSGKIQALRGTINALYNALAGYKSLDSQPVGQQQGVRPLPVAPAPVQAFTFQSILNGALGEPYTSKAKEVYNSGVSFYVDALVKDLNNDITANYTGYESRRIDSLKATIDRLHNFLTNYRRTNQPVAQTPTYAPRPTSQTQALTFQSILNGALGEPYTSKANEIYNRADASYGAVFVEKINEVVNSSSYP